jgi:hypothetical protein
MHLAIFSLKPSQSYSSEICFFKVSKGEDNRKEDDHNKKTGNCVTDGVTDWVEEVNPKPASRS